MTNPLAEAAHRYADLGFFTFPVTPGGKEPLVRWRDQSTIDHDQIDRFWTDFPEANVGIDCGASDLVVVDIDDRMSIDGLSFELGYAIDRDETLIATTPRGGLHVYYQAAGFDVRNSQSKLGPSIDVRGDGGFVLAYPSTTEKGTYAWQNATLPRPIPELLVDLCHVPAHEPPTEEYVPAPELPAPSSSQERWVQSALQGEVDAVAAAAEGTRNARLFEAGLKLFGIVKGGHLEQQLAMDTLMAVGVNRAGQSEHEATQTLRSAWERAIARGPSDWAETPRLVDPPRVDGPDDGEPGFDVLNLEQLANLPPPRWILEHRIPEGMTWLVGPAKTGKSFVALDWAATVAAQGHRVLYFAGEGVHGFASRVVAWAQAHPTADLSGLGVVPTAPRLLDAASAQTYYRTIRRAQPLLVVIDTWSRATAGADENSHAEMSRAIEVVDKAREAYGCSTLIVHHTNAGGYRARGHTSLEGAAEAIWQTEKDENDARMFTVRNTAAKDFEQIPDVLARLQTHGMSAVLTPSVFDRQGVR